MRDSKGWVTSLLGNGARALALVALGSLGFYFATHQAVNADDDATVTTEFQDYSPGSTANITGTGFEADETVTCQVLHIEDDGTVDDDMDHDPWEVTADGNGGFSTTWYVCDECAGATLKLIAEGNSSGRKASHEFTDSGTRIDGWRNTTGAWTTGASGVVQQSNSKYAEGEVIPFRYVEENLNAGSSHTVVLSYDFDDNSGHHFFDWLETYNATVSLSDTTDLVDGVSGLGSSPSYSTTSIPSDSGLSTVTQASGVLTSVNVSSLSFGSYSYANNRKSITVSFTVAGSSGKKSIVLGFGGHLASPFSSPDGWGAGNGASVFPGASPKMRASFDGGSEKNLSVNPNAVVATTVITTVSATDSVYGSGDTVLTATLYNQSSGSYVDNQSIDFSLFGNSVGSATTNSSGVATLTITNDATLTGKPVATYTSDVGASFAGTDTLGASSATGNITVTPAPLTITANSSVKTYGTAVTFAGTEFTSSGLLNSDAISTVALASDGAAATAPYSGSPYAITASGALGIGLGNYTITYVPGTLTLAKKALDITASNQTKAFGTLFTFAGTEFTSTGLVNGDTVATVTLASAGAAASATVAGSPYTIVPSAATGSGLDNYDIAYHNGTLTVTEKTLHITANSLTKTYGQTVTFAGTEFSSTGLEGTDSITSVTLTSAGAVSSASVGSSPYAITPSAAVGTGLSNYTIVYHDGTLTVDPAIASVTADPKSKTYGDANPTLTATVVGEVLGGDAINYSLATAATQFSSVAGSPYAITVSLGSNPNYTVSSTDSTLTINKAIASVTADPKSKTYGDANPTLTATVVGEVLGGDAINYSLATSATQFSSVAGSPYAITVSLGSNPNYTVSSTDSTLTINKAIASVTADPKSKTYGDANPTLTATVVGEVLGGDAINYSLATAATQFSSVAGSPYAITVSLGSNPNYTVSSTDSTLTINKAITSVTADPKSKTYGDANPTLTATVVGEVLGGDAINYSLATSATQFSSVAGSPYAITVTLGSNPNYTVSSTDSTLTINKAIASVTADPKSKTYGDANPTLTATVVGEVLGGDAINYSLATAATQFSSVAGSPYAITVSLGSNPNYTVSSTDSTLTINKAIASVTADPKSKTYGDGNPTLTATVVGEVLGGDAINYSLATAATQFSSVAGSPYAITVSLGSNPNYTVSSTDSTLTINKAIASVTADPKSKTYGDANPTLTATVVGEVLGGDAINYSLATSATQFSSVAGSPYAITVTLGSNPNYTVSSTDSTLTINKAIASVTADPKSKTYGDANPTLTATVVGEVLGGDAINYSLATAATQFSSVAGSPYAITVSLGSNPNYTVSSTDSTLTINKAIASVTADPKSKTYGDANPTLTATVVGEVLGGDAINYSLATAATQFSSVAGSPYAITVSLGSNPNYTVSSTDSTLTINKAIASVTADPKSKTYGDANPTLTATVVGEVLGGDAINYSLATAATQFSSVAGSPYAITVSLGSNPNYTVSSTDSTLTINKAIASVTADPKSKTYGDANPTLTATVVGEVLGGDAINYSLATSATQFSSVAGSPYAITVSLGSNPNYTVSSTDSTLTINKAIASVTADPKSKTYGDANPTLTATVVGEVLGGDAINYSLATSATQFSSVAGSPYAITVTLGSNPNYTVSSTDSTLTINKAIASVTADPKSKTYGDANPTLTATVVGEVLGGDAINYSLATSATQFSSVAGSPYAITVTLGSNPNYTVSSTDSTLTINKAIASVTADPKSKTYGDANPTLTATVVGEVLGGDAINYSLATAATQFSSVAGSPYAITVSLGSNPNYTVSSTDSTLTINKAIASVTADPKSKTYGDANPTLTATVVGEVLGGDAINYSLATAATQFSSVAGSPYAITVSLGSNPNYTVSSTDSTLTINKAIASVTADPKSKTYGDGNPTLTATVVGEVLGGDAINYSLATAATQFSSVAGSPYAITVSLGSNPNYTVSSTDSTLTINKAIASVTADPKSKTYGDANPTLTATVVGEVLGGDAINYSLATSATQFSSVAGSPYAITVTLGSNPNYTVSSTDSTLTINKAIASVTADPKSKTYGDANPTLTATVVGEVLGGDAINYSLATAATQFSSVAGSPYAITVSLGSNPNYTVSSTDSTLTINKAIASVTADPKSKTYGDANPTLTATVVGEVLGGDAINYSLATAATQFSSVAGSPYAITVSLGSNPNYTVSSTDSTLTINKAIASVTADPKSKTYGDANPTLTATVVGEVLGGDAINYSLATAATQFSSVAGSPYAITVSLGSNPNYTVSSTDSTLTINKAIASVTADPKSKTYGDANPTLTATVVGEVLGGDAINYSLATSATQFSSVAGSPYAITVTLGSNPNYTVSSTDSTLTINKAIASVTADPKSKTYGDANPTLTATVVGEVLGGDAINYSLATAATQFSSVAGSPYAITVSLGSNPNYTVSSTDSTLTINKAIASVTADPKSKTYGDANPTLTATVVGEVLGGDAINYSLATAATQFSSVAGSPYAITVSLGSNPNYTVSSTDSTLTINKAIASVTADPKSKTYGDANPTLTATVVGEVLGGDAINYSLATAATQFSSVAGSPYAITVSLGSNPNYTVSSTDSTLTINKAIASVTADPKSKTYGDANPTLTATVVGEVLGGDAINYSLATAATQFSSVAGSPYAITVSLGSNPNYTVSSTDSTLTINKAIASVTADPKSKTYGDANPTLTATVVGEVLGGDAINYSLATSATQFSSVAGSPYAITVTLGSNPNYTVSSTDSTLTINKAIASVTADPKSKTYGDANPTLTATVVGEVLGGDAINYSLATAATQFSSVAGSPYAITVSLGSNPNYTVSSTDSTLTINKAIASVTADPKSKTYGDANPTLTATVVGEVLGGDAINYSLATAATQFSSVAGSPYAITVSLGSNPNYTVSSTDSTLTINKAIASVTADPKSKTYGDANPTLTATVVGEVLGGDAINYSLATAATQFSSVAGSPYAITVSLGSNPNYTVSSTDSTLTINKAIASVTADPKSKTYGDANPTLTATVVGEVLGGDAINYSLATAATQFSSVAGSPYAITVSLGSNPNYTVSSTDSTLTINKAIASVTADPKSKTYGDANPTLTATVVGEVLGGDAINYSLATSATQFSSVAGSPYAITVSLGSNPNYTVSSTDSTLTINKAIASVTADPKSKTYGDANPTLTATVVGEVLGGDAINYSLATAATQFSSVAGSPYAITVSLGSNPNYTVSSTDSTLTINKAIASVTADPKSKTYGDANPTLTATVVGEVLGGDAINYSLATAATQFSSVAGSPYAITVSLGSNPNYTVSSTDSTLTINKAIASVTADPKSKTYGDANPTLTATVVGEVLGGDAINYSLATAATQFSSVAGSPYAITVSLGSNPNYDVTAVNGAILVSPKEALVTANNKSKPFGSLNPALDAVVDGEIPGGDAIEYTLTTTATQFSNVGNYPISVNLGANPNYSVSSEDATLSIFKRTTGGGGGDPVINVNVLGYEGTYDAHSHGSTGGISDTLGTNFTGLFHLGEVYTNANEPGGQLAHWTFDGTDNYEASDGFVVILIHPAEASVTAIDKSKTYGDANPALTATVEGEIVGGDTINYTLSTTATQFSSVAGSPYPITVSLGSNPNYTITTVAAELTVNPALASVTADPKSKTYGDVNPALTAVVVGQVAGGDAINYTLSTLATQFSSVAGSPYAITVTLGSNPNYTVSPTDSALTVNAAIASVTANPKSKTYGDLNPALTATVVGQVVGGDAIDYTLSTTAVQFSSVAGSPYPITVSLGSNPNYTMSSTDSVLTVNAAIASVKADPKSKVFGEVNPTLTATVVGQVAGGDVINYTLATTATQYSSVSGSPYPITVTLGSNPNYTVTKTDSTLTVTKASTTSNLTLTPATQQYSDVVTFTATLTPNAPSVLGTTSTTWPATTVTFKVGTQTMGTVNLTASGGVLTGTLSAALLETVSGSMSPGAKTVTACFGGVDSTDFTVSDKTATLTIVKEDAAAFFTGDCVVTTATATSTSASVLLTATIKDITAYDSGSDSNAGDIRNATVDFVNADTNAVIASNLAVTLVNSSDTKVGTVAYNWTASISSGSDGEDYSIKVIVKNYYTGDSYETDAIGVVTIARPGPGFITGGGYLVLSSSAGSYAGDSGTKNNFGFNVKYNKQKTNIQGHLNTIFRRKENDGVVHVYQVKSTALTSLYTKMTTSSDGKASFAKPSIATFQAKCNLNDVTDSDNPVSIMGGGTIQVCMTDYGEPGSKEANGYTDTIHFIVYDKNGTLLYSSNWNGTTTIEQGITGGNLVVH